MYRSTLPSRSISVASVLAGPIFVGWMLFAGFCAQLPKPVPIAFDLGIVAAAIPMLFLTMGIGFVLALIPATLGSAAMIWAGERSLAMRTPAMWVIVGAALALPLPLLCGWPAIITFALTATGGSCAAICHDNAVYKD